MKKLFKLFLAFALVFVLTFVSVKAQEGGTDPEPPVSTEVTSAPVVSIRGHNNSLILSWEPVENATRYVIERSTNKTKGFKSIATVTTTSYQNLRLTYGTTYYYRVRAHSATNYLRSAVVGRKVVPNKVTGVTLTPYSNQIKIAWNKTSNHGYLVYRSLDGKKWTKVATITKATTTYFVDKKLASNRTYYYQVKAYQKVGRSMVAGISSGVFSIKTAPAAPTLKLINVDIEEMKLNIKAVAGATKYQFYEYNEQTKKWEFDWNIYPEWFEKNIYTQYIYTDKPYHYYSYRVRACSDTACGSFTTIKGYSRLTTGNIEVIRGENKAVNIYAEETYGAQGYEIYRATSAKGKYTRVALLRGEDNTRFRDTKVYANKTYYYKVRSFMKIGKKYYYSAFSAVRSVKTGTNAGYYSAYEDAKRISKDGFFSKALLVNTLVSEYGYKENEALYGVNKCNINYKANALKLTQQYMMFSWAVSEDGIRNILTNFLFTEEEIEYVLDNITIDWHEQLTDAIQMILGWGEGYGRAWIVEELTDEYTGFTEAQVDQVLGELNVDFQAQANMRFTEYLYWYEYARRPEVVSYMTEYGFTDDQITYTLTNYQYDWVEAAEHYYYEIEYYDGVANNFSRNYIIDSLTDDYYGFTLTEAEAALDDLDIDFNEICLEKANQLLGEDYLSENVLRSTLVAYEFNAVEIAYALANINVDFNFNAYIVALEKIDEDGFSSRDALSVCLELHGFTDENVEYVFSQISTETWIRFAKSEITRFVTNYNTNNHMGLSENDVITIMVNQFKFTQAEVEAALEELNMNFAAQALLSAQYFIANGTYSKVSLIALLNNSGYSLEDATSAANSNTIDYGEECVEYITTNYLPGPITESIDTIRDTLSGYGFSDSEIDYAIDATNLESLIEP